MDLFRWLLGLPMAALITVGLFFMMAHLIKDKVDPWPDPRPEIDLKVTADKPRNRPEIDPPEKTIPDDIPETEIDFQKSKEAPKGVPVSPTKTPVDTRPGKMSGNFSGAVIKIPPPYPESCRTKGVEGTVIVQFDITPEGNVTNAQVIQTPNQCFVRTVLKSVSGWKFPPVSSGSAMRYGVIEKFDFRLVD